LRAPSGGSSAGCRGRDGHCQEGTPRAGTGMVETPAAADQALVLEAAQARREAARAPGAKAMRRCVKCRRIKNVMEFYDGFCDRNGFRHRHTCMECMKSIARARYQANPEPQRQRARERKARLRERMQL
jgi:hypothetical protein